MIDLDDIASAAISHWPGIVTDLCLALVASAWLMWVLL